MSSETAKEEDVLLLNGLKARWRAEWVLLFALLLGVAAATIAHFAFPAALAVFATTLGLTGVLALPVPLVIVGIIGFLYGVLLLAFLERALMKANLDNHRFMMNLVILFAVVSGPILGLFIVASTPAALKLLTIPGLTGQAAVVLPFVFAGLITLTLTVGMSYALYTASGMRATQTRLKQQYEPLKPEETPVPVDYETFSQEAGEELKKKAGDYSGRGVVIKSGAKNKDNVVKVSWRTGEFTLGDEDLKIPKEESDQETLAKLKETRDSTLNTLADRNTSGSTQTDSKIPKIEHEALVEVEKTIKNYEFLVKLDEIKALALQGKDKKNQPDYKKALEKLDKVIKELKLSPIAIQWSRSLMEICATEAKLIDDPQSKSKQLLSALYQGVQANRTKPSLIFAARLAFENDSRPMEKEAKEAKEDEETINITEVIDGSEIKSTQAVFKPIPKSKPKTEVEKDYEDLFSCLQEGNGETVVRKDKVLQVIRKLNPEIPEPQSTFSFLSKGKPVDESKKESDNPPIPKTDL